MRLFTSITGPCPWELLNDACQVLKDFINKAILLTGATVSLPGFVSWTGCYICWHCVKLYYSFGREGEQARVSVPQVGLDTLSPLCVKLYYSFGRKGEGGGGGGMVSVPQTGLDTLSPLCVKLYYSFGREGEQAMIVCSSSGIRYTLSALVLTARKAFAMHWQWIWKQMTYCVT